MASILRTILRCEMARAPHRLRNMHGSEWAYVYSRVLCAVVSLASIPGCTRSATGYYGTVEPKHGPEEAWSNLGSEPETLDPGKSAENVGGTIEANIFAGLTQAHPVTLEAMPDIAERWEVENDGTRYTFHLRQSVWSDGEPLTAHDFEYAWRRVLDPRTASKYASFLYPLKYGEQFNRRALVMYGVGQQSEAVLRSWIEPIAPIEQLRLAPDLDAAFIVVGGPQAEQAQLRERLKRELPHNHQALRVIDMPGELVGARARDAHTFVVDLETPLPYFLHLTKFYTTLPVPRHVIEGLAKAGKDPELWTRPEHIVSNGAYSIKEAKFRQYIVLEKNPRYWDAEHVKLKRVKLAMIDSANTVLNMYQAGELDTIGQSGLPSEFLDLLRTQRDFRSTPHLSVYYYWLNTQAPPLDDVRVRQALSLAIDRQSLVDNITRGGQVPSADMVPVGLAGYPGLHSGLFDPAGARALLRDAGWGPEHPLPPLTLRYNTSEGHKQLAEAVQAMWRQHLGLHVELENQEWKVYLKSVEAYDFQIARAGWIGDYPDPLTFLDLLASYNGNNHSNWRDPHYDELLERANRQRDPQARLQILLDAERYLMRAAPVIPVYVATRSELVKPYLRGHARNYEDRQQFKYWWIDERWYHGLPKEPAPEVWPESPSHSAEADKATPAEPSRAVHGGA